MMVGELRPVSLARDGDGLKIAWTDGATTTVSFTTLRSNCPCAGCQHERAQPPDPFKVLKPSEVSAGPPVPAAMKPVGHYAYQIIWNDGHDTGIYTLETLRRLSQSVP